PGRGEGAHRGDAVAQGRDPGRGRRGGDLAAQRPGEPHQRGGAHRGRRVHGLRAGRGGGTHMTPEALQGAVQELLDRQAILDCLNRYARGLDRKDLDVLRSAFHPDATDHHGGSIEYHPAADALIADWETRDIDRSFSQHLIINTSIDLDGDTAHAESYFQLIVGLKPEVRPEQPRLSIGGGRYVDRFERRDGEWRIARRVLVLEYSTAWDENDALPWVREWARRNADDPSYARPLLGPPAG